MSFAVVRGSLRTGVPVHYTDHSRLSYHGGCRTASFSWGRGRKALHSAPGFAAALQRRTRGPHVGHQRGQAAVHLKGLRFAILGSSAPSRHVTQTAAILGSPRRRLGSPGSRGAGLVAERSWGERSGGKLRRAARPEAEGRRQARWGSAASPPPKLSWSSLTLSSGWVRGQLGMGRVGVSGRGAVSPSAVRWGEGSGPGRSWRWGPALRALRVRAGPSRLCPVLAHVR